MERTVTDPTAIKVLIFFNKSYVEKTDARQHGGGIETQILSAELYGKVQQEKFIPIVCEFENGQACLPTFLKGRLCVDFSSPETEATNYKRLARHIFDRPEHIKPAVGKPPVFITPWCWMVSTSARLRRPANYGKPSNKLRRSWSFCLPTPAAGRLFGKWWFRARLAVAGKFPPRALRPVIRIAS
jgi:hypothetical protein